MTSSPAQAPSHIRAVVLDKSSDGPATVSLHSLPRKDPGPGEAVVSLRAAALNRRDLYIWRGLYSGLRYPSILGSDGAGVVTAVGSGVSESWVGTEVVIYPALAWGGKEEHSGPHFRVLGMPDSGTFADEIVIAAENLAKKPAHLSWSEAAALPLAGLTAYRASIARGGLRPGETVIIPGIGSGVSTMVLMLAKHLGARVVVTSSSPEKLARARQLGADIAVNYRDADWDKQIAKALGDRKADLCVDGVGGETWGRCVPLLRPSGRIVSYGATSGLTQIDLRRLFWQQLNILGSTMGSPRDFAELLALVSAGRLRPLIDAEHPLENAAEALERMERGEQMGKIVLQIS